MPVESAVKRNHIVVELLSPPSIVDAREFSDGTSKSRQQMKSDHPALENRMGVGSTSTECLKSSKLGMT